MKVGERLNIRGYITQLHCVAGKSGVQLESLLGYKAGRLAGGWALLELCSMPKPDDFEFRGYSYFSGGMIEGHKDEKKKGKTAEVRLKDGKFDVEKLKYTLIEKTFSVSGAKRLVKVLPKDGASGSRDYPPGSGVPQWELVKKLPFRVIAVLLPEGKKWQSKEETS